MTVPMDQGRPIWVDDDRFDISYHVRLTALPKPGTWEQLLTLTGRIEAQILDRRRPLWELWFVEGLESGGVALVQKTHHALVDGVSGVDVATVLLDFTPDTPVAIPPRWAGARTRAARDCSQTRSSSVRPSRPRWRARCAASRDTAASLERAARIGHAPPQPVRRCRSRRVRRSTYPSVAGAVHRGARPARRREGSCAGPGAP